MTSLKFHFDSSFWSSCSDNWTGYFLVSGSLPWIMTEPKFKSSLNLNFCLIYFDKVSSYPCIKNPLSNNHHKPKNWEKRKETNHLSSLPLSHHNDQKAQINWKPKSQSYRNKNLNRTNGNTIQKKSVQRKTKPKHPQKHHQKSTNTHESKITDKTKINKQKSK